MPERIEQHIGTILQVMVIALLGWSLSTTVSLKTDVDVLKTQVSMLNNTIQQGVADRVAVAAIRADVSNFERRLSLCEAYK
jgi:Tfp pilus assembly protein PilO